MFCNRHSFDTVSCSGIANVSRSVLRIGQADVIILCLFIGFYMIFYSENFAYLLFAI